MLAFNILRPQNFQLNKIISAFIFLRLILKNRGIKHGLSLKV